MASGSGGGAHNLNFNIGVLGHIDSGKTSLAKALSEMALTASFDKNPQSKERGITLDLGFSTFMTDIPDHLKSAKYERLQFALVDCPGHASLIRTIIGGVQIIDLMMLVVDVTKGVQTQTAECLVIGEIICEKMIVVLNKIDLLQPAKKQQQIEKMKKRMAKTLENTRFAGCPMISVAAKPGGPEAPDTEAEGVDILIEELKKQAYLPKRSSSGAFIYAVDHCFSIRGQGTVMTGTVLSGSVSVNDNIEIPALKMSKKVKSIQMFRKPVNSIMQGDRAGLCVTQFDPKLLERGMVCTPGALPTIYAAIVDVKKIGYYKGNIATKAKFHITTGHATVMGRLSFFGCYKDDIATTDSGFNFDEEYLYQDELLTKVSSKKADDNKENESDLSSPLPNQQYCLIEFEKSITCPENSLLIGSKLDTDIHANMCRLAFHGHIVHAITDKNYSESVLPRIKIFKNKTREGFVERMLDDYNVIGRGLFKKETNIQLFIGLKVDLSTGERGVIEGGFGQSGKYKIRIPDGLKAETKSMLSSGGKKKGKGKQTPQQATDDASVEAHQPIHVVLKFKRYIHDPKKKMMQT
ncbi:selenocysteine-specific elongation factor-like [Saccoglossus kowalevskii]|uniref:Selenocysteine-specific elongation factor-like n=1 Tax=Saccoglossus kowalevskii TaxID=10224 RepID=A0ABM0GI95_SACKO|nr:PREDICTED: selenocysteine-specific elongation factor-like [Saccoglossus kowalevskii]